MAKQEKNAQKTAPVATQNTETDVMTEIRNKNIGEAELAKTAYKRLQDEQNERLLEEKKRKIAQADYINKRARLMLRARRREEDVTKAYLTETKELLDQLTGYTDKDGKEVPPTLTPNEYEDKRRECVKKKDKGINDSERQFREELNELRFLYPSYWSYEWNE